MQAFHWSWNYNHNIINNDIQYESFTQMRVIISIEEVLMERLWIYICVIRKSSIFNANIEPIYELSQPFGGIKR